MAARLETRRRERLAPERWAAAGLGVAVAWQAYALVSAAVQLLDPAPAAAPLRTAASVAAVAVRGDVASLFGVAPTAAQPAAATSTLALVGTIAYAGGGYAIVRADGPQRIYAVGAALPGGDVLLRVHADRIEVGPAGAQQGIEIRLPSANLAGLGVALVAGAASEDAVGGETSDDAYFDAVARARQDATFVTSIVSAAPSGNGMRHIELRPSGGVELMRSVGLQPGDWVTHVGGRPVSDPAVAASLKKYFTETGGTAKLTVQRGDQGLVTVEVKLPRR